MTGIQRNQQNNQIFMYFTQQNNQIFMYFQYNILFPSHFLQFKLYSISSLIMVLQTNTMICREISD